MAMTDAGQSDNEKSTREREKPKSDFVRVHTTGSRATVSQRVITVTQSNKIEKVKPQ